MGRQHGPKSDFVSPPDWDEQIAVAPAPGDILALEDHHWPVLGFRRKFWNGSHTAIHERQLPAFLAQALDADKTFAKADWFECFHMDISTEPTRLTV